MSLSFESPQFIECASRTFSSKEASWKSNVLKKPQVYFIDKWIQVLSSLQIFLVEAFCACHMVRNQYTLKSILRHEKLKKFAVLFSAIMSSLAGKVYRIYFTKR